MTGVKVTGFQILKFILNSTILLILSKKYCGLMKKDKLIWVVVGLAAAAGISAVLFLDTTGKSGSGLSKEFEFDVSEYSKTDSSQVIYEQLPDVIKTGMEEVKAVAVDDSGNLYVAGDKRIERIGGMKIELSEMPLCLDVDNQGRIYAGLGDHVEVYDADGKQVAKWESPGEGVMPTSIAAVEKYVFLADAGRRVVVRYDLDGNVINEIDGRGEQDKEGFVIPSPYFDIAIVDDGRLAVVNPGMHKIEVYSFDGKLKSFWGSSGMGVEGFCGCCNPINIAVLSDGSYVTCEKGLVRIKVYDSDGRFEGVVAGKDILVGESGKSSGGRFDVAVDNSGRVYVLDTDANVVKVFVRK